MMIYTINLFPFPDMNIANLSSGFSAPKVRKFSPIIIEI